MEKKIHDKKPLNTFSNYALKTFLNKIETMSCTKLKLNLGFYLTECYILLKNCSFDVILGLNIMVYLSFLFWGGGDWRWSVYNINTSNIYWMKKELGSFKITNCNWLCWCRNRLPFNAILSYWCINSNQPVPHIINISFIHPPCFTCRISQSFRTNI